MSNSVQDEDEDTRSKTNNTLAKNKLKILIEGDGVAEEQSVPVYDQEITLDLILEKVCVLMIKHANPQV